MRILATPRFDFTKRKRAREVRNYCAAILLAVPLIATTLIGSTTIALADSATVLMKRVDTALRADRRLNGAECYTAAPGVIVLYGKVFDDKDRTLAESTARKVHGVKQVVNTLRTATGQWLAEESRINDTLLLNGFEGVSARVIGPEVYLSGQVSSAAEKQRVVRVVSSVSNLQVVNFIRIVPGPLF
jgi:osmotically-inducible protein OsmY